MEHRRTKDAERIDILCEHSRFSPTVVYWKSEKILSRYRDIRNLPTMVTKDAEEITEKTIALIREKFHKTYVKKECAQTGSLDYILCEILNLEFADEVIDAVFTRMKQMLFHVDEDRDIIDKIFLRPFEASDTDIRLEIGMSKTTYYRKKKEAITLFGILLWNIMLERSQLAT